MALNSFPNSFLFRQSFDLLTRVSFYLRILFLKTIPSFNVFHPRSFPAAKHAFTSITCNTALFKKPSSSRQQQMSIPYRQDLPPAGGFAEIKYKRNLPFKGPGALTILLGVAAMSAYGFYKVGQSNLEKRELEREKVWSRIHLVPLIVAEGDRAAYHRRQADVAMEKAIMKDVPGWEAGKSVYHNSKYESPRIDIR